MFSSSMHHYDIDYIYMCWNIGQVFILKRNACLTIIAVYFKESDRIYVMHNLSTDCNDGFYKNPNILVQVKGIVV